MHLEFQQECCIASAINIELYRAAVTIHQDLEIAAGGEPSTPIHDALGWQYKRFGLQVRDNLEGAIFFNEDGTPWQVKLAQAKIDKVKTIKTFKQTLNLPESAIAHRFSQLICQHPHLVKRRKYETPIGNGSKPYLPPISANIRQRISQRYGLEVPLSGSFWQWLAQHPEVPILITEGAKKSLCLLSQGYVAIALYGVNGGYRSKDALGYPVKPYLIPELLPFVAGDRSVILAFDQDAAVKTRRRVAIALSRFGRLLEAQGAAVNIVQWDGTVGKGVDDFIVAAGAEAFKAAIDQALPLEHWKLWNALDSQLTHKADIQLNVPEMRALQPESIPDEGIVAIAAPKGSGKTNLIAALTADSERLLPAGHRIALMRNLCQRLGADYRGDLDKAQGQFISGAGYTLRVGTCVESLLAINPNQFAGCDLVLDEVVQVLRSLLTSSTCNRDGRRPALLARFHQLVQVARRVILADADLNNDVLDYIAELRGDRQKPYLIRNDYKTVSYSVHFIEAKDASVITARLLADIQSGKKVFIATDSKAGSKKLERLVAQIEGLGLHCLLLNSETSGGEIEQAFIQNPNAHLEDFDVVIATPSMATGVSIEVAYFDRVYGLFWGVSSTDADMSQALGRVRPPVERVVWCAEHGRNYSSLSRSTSHLFLKKVLRDKTHTSASLIRSSLREDITGAIAAYDWQSDPHLNLWARFEAERNRSMGNLRLALKVRLQWEGNHVKTIAAETDQVAKLLLKEARDAVKAMAAQQIANANNLTYLEYEALKNKENPTPEERLAAAKFAIADFYCLPVEAITAELVEADNNGRRRGELMQLESLLHPDTAIGADAGKLEKQANWQRGLTPWDMSHAELKRQLRQRLGLTDFLDKSREWTRYDLEEFAERAKAIALQIKLALHFTIKEEMSPVQVAHQLLAQLGIKTEFRWSRSMPGYEGQKLRVYRLNVDIYQQQLEVLQRRAERRDRIAQSQVLPPGSSPEVIKTKNRDDPTQIAHNTSNAKAQAQADAIVKDSLSTEAIQERSTYFIALAFSRTRSKDRLFIFRILLHPIKRFIHQDRITRF
ncbi:plasmid replication protein, CyRepA1 family [Almyronema epifaneia]|uniref:Plasmid replication protein, CyRepA1 family n=1 Tax=Almyronema epifaneia S1 TaxID=2991925 RepID=A0ABW6IJP5_9CYAN